MKRIFVIPLFALLLAACNNTGQQQGMEQGQPNENTNEFTPNQVSFGPGSEHQPMTEERSDRFDIPVNPGREQNIFRQPSMEQGQGANNNGQTAQPNKAQQNDNNQTEQPNRTQQNQNTQNTDMSDFQSKVVDLTNQERERNGLQPLKPDTDLMRAAQVKSDDMASNDYFSHTSPTYGTPFDMLKKFGIQYTTAAENIAAGQQTPQAVVDGWMNSPGHRKNILNQDVTHIGVGHATDGNYWTQLFIKK